MATRLTLRPDEQRIVLSNGELQIIRESLTMMIQELNRFAQAIDDENRAATLNGQPLNHAPDVVNFLMVNVSRAYDLRERLELEERRV